VSFGVGLPPGIGALGGQLGALAQLIATISAQLADVQQMMRGAGEARTDVIVASSFSSLSNPAEYRSAAQIRITALKVYTEQAGLFRVQIGNDSSMAFLSTANGTATPIDGDNQEVTLSRGTPITIVPPAGNWYAIMFWRSGESRGKQGP
jgi:hypothetical protein